VLATGIDAEAELIIGLLDTININEVRAIIIVTLCSKREGFRLRHFICNSIVIPYRNIYP
jgi:hypothetical protein